MELGVSKQQKLFFVAVNPLASRQPRLRVWSRPQLLSLGRAPDAVHAGALEGPYPLPVLDDSNYEHEERSGDHGSTAASDMLVEDISSSQGLHDEGQQVTQPELVVDEGVGGDGVLAAKVQQEETAPGQRNASSR
jgi:hypothetical protein